MYHLFGNNFMNMIISVCLLVMPSRNSLLYNIIAFLLYLILICTTAIRVFFPLIQCCSISADQLSILMNTLLRSEASCWEPIIHSRVPFLSLRLWCYMRFSADWWHSCSITSRNTAGWGDIITLRCSILGGTRSCAGHLGGASCYGGC